MVSQWERGSVIAVGVKALRGGHGEELSYLRLVAGYIQDSCLVVSSVYHGAYLPTQRKLPGRQANGARAVRQDREVYRIGVLGKEKAAHRAAYRAQFEPIRS